jgi:hypothetical protein
VDPESAMPHQLRGKFLRSAGRVSGVLASYRHRDLGTKVPTEFKTDVPQQCIEVGRCLNRLRLGGLNVPAFATSSGDPALTHVVELQRTGFGVLQVADQLTSTRPSVSRPLD